MRTILTTTLLFSSLLLAEGTKVEPTGQEVYKTKCASCHQLYISPSKLIENFMEQNNSILKLTAPTVNQIVFRLKSRIGDPKGDQEIHRMEVDSFIADYLMNPDKEKSVCLPKVLKHFKTMPSLKGKISVDEIEAVSGFFYDYNPDDYVEHKMPAIAYEKALKVAKEKNKIILIKLSRENCHFCEKMDREVFSDEEVIEAMNKDFTVVSLDIGKEALPLNLKKGMTPTFIFVNKNEKIMAKIPGSWTKKDFLEILKEAVKAKGEKK
jgi:thioredoxin-related protein